MAGSLNKVMLIGNLGADPEVRYTASGTCVANFRIATTDRWKDDKGEKQERTEWHRIVCWGRLGETAGEYLAKGSSVHVEGSLQTRQWEKDGVTRYTTEVKAFGVQFLDSKRDSPARDSRSNGNQRGGQQGNQRGGQQGNQQRDGQRGNQQQRQSQTSMQHDYGPPPIDDDDVPF